MTVKVNMNNNNNKYENMPMHRSRSRTLMPTEHAFGNIHLDDISLSEVITTICRNFSIGLFARGTFSILPHLIRGKFPNSQLINLCYGSKESKEFAALIAFSTGGYKFSRYIIENYIWKKTKLDKDNNNHNKRISKSVLISAIFGGLGILFVDPNTRWTMGLYLGVRAVDDYLRNRNVLGSLRSPVHSDTAVFIFAQMIIIYCFCCNREALNPSYLKFLCNIGYMSSDSLAYYFNTKHDVLPPCNDCFHPLGCTHYFVYELYACFVRALKMYLPVHFLPIFVMRFKNVLENPIYFLKRILLGAARSAAFLDVYIVAVKVTNCFLRYWLQKDDGYHATAAGFMAGLSLLVEDPRRRSELVLYTLPRALEAAVFLISNYIKVKPSDNIYSGGAIMTYMTAVALMIYNYTHYPEHMKRTNYHFVNFLLSS